MDKTEIQYKLGDYTFYNPRTLRRCFMCNSTNYERVILYVTRITHKMGKIQKQTDKADGGHWKCLDCGITLNTDGQIDEMNGQMFI